MNSILSASTTLAPTIVNGLNVDDLHGLIEAVEADPAQAATHWCVASRWQGRTHSRSEVASFDLAGKTIGRRFSIDIDEPAELGGGNAYANPQEYLLAALNACMIVGYTALCALNGITLEKLEITTEGDIDLRGFLGLDASTSPGYDSLVTRVTIKGNGTTDQFTRIHELVKATSPNLHNISKAIRVNPVLTVL